MQSLHVSGFGEHAEVDLGADPSPLTSVKFKFPVYAPSAAQTESWTFHSRASRVGLRAMLMQVHLAETTAEFLPVPGERSSSGIHVLHVKGKF